MFKMIIVFGPVSKLLFFFGICRLLLFQVEGKGNGIKTVIVNMPEVAKALSRPPTCK